MDRLTVRLDEYDGYEDIAFKNPRDSEGMYDITSLNENSFEAERLDEIAERYAEYEDIGLTPAQIIEWKENSFDPIELVKLNIALKELKELKTKIADGRMIELPCKVGDTVYSIQAGHGVSEFEITEIRTLNGKWCALGDRVVILDFDDFGKTVFLTKEAAEAALQEHQHE